MNTWTALTEQTTIICVVIFEDVKLLTQRSVSKPWSYVTLIFFFPVNYCDYKDKCSHNCYNAPEGYICGCPENMYLQNDNVTCADTHRCDVWGICSQKCVPIGQHSHKCTCFPEYEIQPDHFTCKSVGMYLY